VWRSAFFKGLITSGIHPTLFTRRSGAPYQLEAVAADGSIAWNGSSPFLRIWLQSSRAEAKSNRYYAVARPLPRAPASRQVQGAQEKFLFLSRRFSQSTAASAKLNSDGELVSRISRRRDSSRHLFERRGKRSRLSFNRWFFTDETPWSLRC